MSRAEIVPAAALYSCVVDIVKQQDKKSRGLVQSHQEGRELPFIYVENKGGGLYKDDVNSAEIPRALLNTHQDGHKEQKHERSGQKAKTTSETTYNQFIQDYSL